MQWDPNDGVNLDLSKPPPKVVQFVQAHAELLCCSSEAFFFPLLTVVSATCNGAMIKLDEECEFETPLTLFMVMAQPSGGGKVEIMMNMTIRLPLLLCIVIFTINVYYIYRTSRCTCHAVVTGLGTVSNMLLEVQIVAMSYADISIYAADDARVLVAQYHICLCL